MCGIAGCIAKQGNLIPNSTILRMAEAIHHRGPDDEGFILYSHSHELETAGGKDTPDEVWNSQTEFCPKKDIKKITHFSSRVALGHRRLSILDLSANGHQPMSYENGRYWIVYNGEIYNFFDIRCELEKAGCILNTKCDTEVLIAAYAEWGEACLDKFVGMWAFAILDTKKNEIFIARDRYGIKPLYYYFSLAGDFYFASEIKQFTVIPGWIPRLNPQRVYDQLIYSFTDHTDETMFKGVFQVQPGACYKSTIENISSDAAGRLCSKKWYQLKPDPFKGSFEDAIASFKELFERAVREHLYADVPVGTALSGGLDSSSIVCEVNKILRAQGTEALQKTFSSCSEDEHYYSTYGS
jgi:asparagine synthase (glutamine-hydrolysing)